MNAASTSVHHSSPTSKWYTHLFNACKPRFHKRSLTQTHYCHSKTHSETHPATPQRNSDVKTRCGLASDSYKAHIKHLKQIQKKIWAILAPGDGGDDDLVSQTQRAQDWQKEHPQETNIFKTLLSQFGFDDCFPGQKVVKPRPADILHTLKIFEETLGGLCAP